MSRWIAIMVVLLCSSEVGFANPRHRPARKRSFEITMRAPGRAPEFLHVETASNEHGRIQDARMTLRRGERGALEPIGKDTRFQLGGTAAGIAVNVRFNVVRLDLTAAALDSHMRVLMAPAPSPEVSIEHRYQRRAWRWGIGMRYRSFLPAEIRNSDLLTRAQRDDLLLKVPSRYGLISNHAAYRTGLDGGAMAVDNMAYVDQPTHRTLAISRPLTEGRQLVLSTLHFEAKRPPMELAILYRDQFDH